MSLIISRLWSARRVSVSRRGGRHRGALRPAVERLEALQLLSSSPSLHFAFGKPTTPVANGYTAVSPTAYTAAKGFGWSSASSIYADDSYNANTTPRVHGYNYGINDTFLVDLPNGTYDVTPTFKNPTRGLDGIALYGQGKVLATGLGAQADHAITSTYQVTVTNGQLALRIADLSGQNPYFAIASLDITPDVSAPVVTTSTGVAHFAFGKPSTPVASGYTAVAPTAYTAGKGFGWLSASSIYADDSYNADTTPRVHGYNYGVNDTFLVDLPNGTYDVTPTLENPRRGLDGIAMYAQGKVLATGLGAQADHAITSTYQVTVTNGQLALRIADLSGQNPYFAITNLDITPASKPAPSPGPTPTPSPAPPPTSGQVTIDEAWLHRAGAGPYILNQANTTYVLATDVRTNGTAFVVAAANVTLDLNGHTVTYGDSTPISVPNNGFEQGSTGWDLTKAPGASVVANTKYLFGKQMLSLANISTSAQISSSNIAIPQANHTYTATITPLSGQETTTVTLSVIDAVTGQVLGTASSYSPQRGFSAVVNFTPTTTHPVRLRVVVTPPSGQTDTVYLDDATLSSSSDYGIVASPQWGGQIPGFSNLPAAAQASYRSTSGFTVENGSIVQGNGNGYGSMPIYAEEIAGLTIANVKTSDTGMDNAAVDANYATGAVTISGSTFQEGAYNISNRMRDYATLQLNSTDGTVNVTGNQILGSPELGIMATYNNVDYPFLIANNTIKQNSVVTNGYAISTVALGNFQIASNTIEPVSGRGIDVDGWSATPTIDGQIKNNYVSTQERPNREYGNVLNAFALRVRNNVDAEGPHRNLTFSGNTFISTTGTGMVAGAIAARITYGNNNGAMNDANIVFDNNTFQAIVTTTDPAYYAQALDIDSMDAGINPVFSNNVLSSNNVSLQLTGPDGTTVDGVQLTGNTISRSSLGAARTYSSVVAGYWIDPVSDVQLIDTKYANGALPIITWSGSGTKNIQVLDAFNISAAYSGGEAIPQATVTVTDARNKVVFSGTTDSQGKASTGPMLVAAYQQTGTDPSKIVASGSNGFTVTVVAGKIKKSQVIQPGLSDSVDFLF